MSAPTRKEPYTRTRNGCGRCRKQHRKCDEGKPSCTRCSDARVDCEYSGASSITFRDKNAHSLSSRAAGSQAAAPKYAKIKFVDHKSSSSEVDTTQDSLVKDDALDAASRKSGLDIGNGRHQDRRDENRTRHREHAALSQPLHSANSREHSEAEHIWPLVGKSALSDAEAELMRFYCHHIAPWLDIYDPQHRTFTTLVPQLATNSPCVLEPLLHIAAAASRSPPNLVVRREGVGMLHLKNMITPIGQEDPFLAVRVMTGFALLKTKSFILESPESIIYSGSVFPRWYPDLCRRDPAEQRVWTAILVLLCRTEIAYSIEKRTPPGRMQELLMAIMISLEDSHDEPNSTHCRDDILLASIRCLELVVRVMNFCFTRGRPENPQQAPSDSSSVDQVIADWGDLHCRLTQWQEERPATLKPLFSAKTNESNNTNNSHLETPAAAADTRTAMTSGIFTSAAGISTAILFHCSMILLLHHRPRGINATLPTAEGPPTTWHARRICDVVLDHDPREIKYWDPCMTAALALAVRELESRGMIDADLQQRIIGLFGGLETIGWCVSGLVEEFKVRWEMG